MTHNLAMDFIATSQEWSDAMKRLLILTACAALLLSGCRSCPWWKKRGAPCRSSINFDPYAKAGPACGQDVNVHYGTPDCPNCLPGGGYYDSGLQTVPSVPEVPYREVAPTLPLPNATPTTP